MFKQCDTRFKLAITSLFITTLFYNATVTADPVILPSPEPFDAPPVFCFKVTGGDVLTAGGVRIQFEILNWTGEEASYLQVNQSGDPQVNTGGFFDFDTATTTAANGWIRANVDAGGVNFTSIGSSGSALQGIDLDPLNDLSFSAYPAVVPNPLDSGINTLDGFILEFPDFDPFERVVLQWDLFNDSFSSVDSTTVRNPFSFGTFQIDRAANGSVRVVTAFSIGTSIYDITDMTPLDPVLTDLNAITLPATGMSAVPVPATLWLMLSGLVGLVTVSRRKHCNLSHSI